MTPVAHAGGVDEIAFMLLPAAVFYIIFALRRRHLPPAEEASKDPADERPAR